MVALILKVNLFIITYYNKLTCFKFHSKLVVTWLQSNHTYSLDLLQEEMFVSSLNLLSASIFSVIFTRNMRFQNSTCAS